MSCLNNNIETLLLKNSTHILNYYRYRVGKLPDPWKMEYYKINLRNDSCCVDKIPKINEWL